MFKSTKYYSLRHNTIATVMYTGQIDVRKMPHLAIIVILVIK